MPGRCAIDALRLQAAVIDLHGQPGLLQPLVLQRGEPLAPLCDQCRSGLGAVQLPGLLPQAIMPQAARGQQDMGWWLR